MTSKSTARCLISLVFLNLTDICVTIALVSTNIAKELNPLINYVLGFGIIPFIIVKTAAVSFACYVFWKYRNHILSKIGIFVSLFAYLLLILYFLVEIL